MKQKSIMFKRGFYTVAASALFLSSGLAGNAWAQRPLPPPPVGNQPRIQPPVDPRRVIVVNAPTIEVPAENSGVDLDKPLVVAGTGTRDGRIDVSVKGEWTAPTRRGSQTTKKTRRTLNNSTVRVAPQGDWKTDPITLNIPKEATNIKFEISAVQRIGDKTSEATVINTRPALKALPLQAPPLTVVKVRPSISITFPGRESSVIASNVGGVILKGTATGDNAVRVVAEKTVASTRKRFRLGGGSNKFIEEYTHYDTSKQTLRDILVKNGRWEVPLDMSPGKVKGEVKKVSYKVRAYLQNNTAFWTGKEFESIHKK